MKVENLSRIPPDRVTVKFRSYMRYNPKFRSNYITKRRQSSFLYIIKGSYEFYYDGGNIFAASGDTVYLPEDSAYGYRLLSETAECIQIEFAAFIDGEPFGFSVHPTVVRPNAIERAGEQFLKINFLYINTRTINLRRILSCQKASTWHQFKMKILKE